MTTAEVGCFHPYLLAAKETSRDAVPEMVSTVTIPYAGNAALSAATRLELATTMAFVIVRSRSKRSVATLNPVVALTMKSAFNRLATFAATVALTISLGSLLAMTIVRVVTGMFALSAVTASIAVPTAESRHTCGHGPGGEVSVGSMSTTSLVGQGTAPESVTPDMTIV
jgi:hypothetical protein